MSRFNTILFDLDGTLWDSAPGIINCFRYTFDRMGYEMPENLMSLIGPPIYDTFAETCGMNQSQVAEAVSIYREQYAAKGLFESSVYDGIENMLGYLKNSGKTLLVATSKPEPFAVKILDKFGLAKYFNIIGGADIKGSRNNKHEIIEYVLSLAGISERNKAIMVGDRKHDIIGARKCRIACMAVLWGYGNIDEFTEYMPDYIADTPETVSGILTG